VSSHWIDSPTIESLRIVLDVLESEGWGLNQKIQIKQLTNAPSCFVISQVEESEE
jgi:hypothetical protein